MSVSAIPVWPRVGRDVLNDLTGAPDSSPASGACAPVAVPTWHRFVAYRRPAADCCGDGRDDLLIIRARAAE